ncbi:hypothetical protein SAMN02745121_08171 [Nannocystis exedens]|uniref:Uncharacterized protein n=2 Tax=Nannocystis exedens TaxID=54 RepID=A0A1I2HSV4_9BACT|nr:hypothetical protein [Nannocystis exedens]PCC69893.1 oxidoreductase [Nannocystis exedens]SFF32668.1 hypothetical protein SAMN02745121_08171 [Nannocystis exedens]
MRDAIVTGAGRGILLSDRAGFVTGQDFVVDAGMSRAMIYAESRLDRRSSVFES